MLTDTHLSALRSAAARETEGSMPISPAVVIALVEEVWHLRGIVETATALDKDIIRQLERYRAALEPLRALLEETNA